MTGGHPGPIRWTPSVRDRDTRGRNASGRGRRLNVLRPVTYARRETVDRLVSSGQDRRPPAQAPAVDVTENEQPGPTRIERRTPMAVARVTELSATSPDSFDDAITQGVTRATKTLRNVTSAWVKEQRVEIKDNRIVEYQVNMLVTFVLDD